MFKVFKEEVEFGGKKLTIETGKIARQADGAIIATCGETVVISTVVGAKKVNEEIDYFENESSIDLISLNYEKRLERRDSKRDEVETRRNNKLEELGYSSDYDFEDFGNETILNEVYSVMIDMILQKNHRASSASNNLQDSS